MVATAQWTHTQPINQGMLVVWKRYQIGHINVIMDAAIILYRLLHTIEGRPNHYHEKCITCSVQGPVLSTMNYRPCERAGPRRITNSADHLYTDNIVTLTGPRGKTVVTRSLLLALTATADVFSQYFAIEKIGRSENNSYRSLMDIAAAGFSLIRQ